jgi:hypothetical protein
MTGTVTTRHDLRHRSCCQPIALHDDDLTLLHGGMVGLT